MGRPKRTDLGGLVYHVLNRANAQMTIFESDADYEAFESVVAAAVERVSMRLLAYCVMPNHWHLVLHPRKDGDLSRFMTWLTLTHTQRRHAHRHTTGTGHLYQGRYKSFVTQSDTHLLSLGRYVERNALRAKLVSAAERWPWCSLWRRTFGNTESKALLSAWPIDRPRQWRRWVNEPQSEDELKAIRHCITRSRPFGTAPWVNRTAARLGLETTLRPRGRPRKNE